MTCSYARGQKRHLRIVTEVIHFYIKENATFFTNKVLIGNIKNNAERQIALHRCKGLGMPKFFRELRSDK